VDGLTRSQVSGRIAVPREKGELWGTPGSQEDWVEHRTVSKVEGTVSPTLHSVMHTAQLLLPSRMRAINSVTCSKV
jgi:hypothetical protein